MGAQSADALKRLHNLSKLQRPEVADAEVQRSSPTRGPAKGAARMVSSLSVHVHKCVPCIRRLHHPYRACPFLQKPTGTDAEAHLSASAEGRAGGVRLEFDSICAVKSCNVHRVYWMHTWM